MISAVKAVRAHSRASTPARLAVLLILASYADKDGENAFPSWDTLQEQSKASRDTVASALREAVENGEVVCTGQRPKKTKIYSFYPIIHSPTIGLQQSDDQTAIVRPADSRSPTSRLDQAVTSKEKAKNKKNPRDVGPASDTGLSVLDASKNNGGPTRFEREQELRYLIAKNDAAPTAGTEAQISEVRASLNGAVS